MRVVRDRFKFRTGKPMTAARMPASTTFPGLEHTAQECAALDEIGWNQINIAFVLLHSGLLLQPIFPFWRIGQLLYDALVVSDCIIGCHVRLSLNCIL